MENIESNIRIQAILTIDTTNLPSNFQEVIKHEQEVVEQWKNEGILDHLFLRDLKNGAVLIFKNKNHAFKFYFEILYFNNYGIFESVGFLIVKNSLSIHFLIIFFLSRHSIL